MSNLEFAINMELDGEKYYTEQAQKNKDNHLNIVFLMLAKDEANHAIVLKNKFNELPYELKDNNTLPEFKNVFKGIADFTNGIEKIPYQVDVYRTALEREKQSIDLYEKFLSESTDDKAKRLFEYLVKQEEDHFTILEDIVTFVNRPTDWVESAEFGIRKEY